ncbi:hypothetical protein PR202_ga09451 [Eleusine coracana subsp. coracana]|uniref:Katanin p80 subunit C-terminal domain-containing protein n=1 Tax=Eleusine coracana subsp. coracana TaxID=191504 RepID=A0AAV5C410_ELECO|nr:hypothetical protein PR202_ga09451 [Eleusine coracana subsp. coracana]
MMLKVFSWEPVRCHDVVDMGWTNMADLSIYEGKLLGCSYHERCVGLWAADISGATPMRRMKVADSPSTNPRTVELAVPLGKTKSLVERFEKRETSSIDCSPQTSSCGDHAVQPDGPSSHPRIKSAIAAVIKLPDNAVQADVVSALKGKLDLFNLEIFSSFLPVLAGLLSSKTERHATVSLEMLLDLIKIFGPVIQSTLSANSAVGVDLQAEQRRGGQQAQLAQELSLSLQDLVVI